MKHLILSITMAFFCSTSLAYAHMPDEDEWTRQVEQQQERMKTMQEQMDAIANTQDPQERQRLLADHWQTMSEQTDQMNMMGDRMTRNGMMGDCMMRPAMIGEQYASQMYGMMHHQVMMMHGGAPRDAEGMGMHKGMHEDMHPKQQKAECR